MLNKWTIRLPDCSQGRKKDALPQILFLRGWIPCKVFQLPEIWKPSLLQSFYFFKFILALQQAGSLLLESQHKGLWGGNYWHQEIDSPVASLKRMGMKNCKVQHSQASLTHCKPSSDLVDSSPPITPLKGTGTWLNHRKSRLADMLAPNCLYDIILPMLVSDLCPHVCFPYRCLWHSAHPRLLQTAWGIYNRNT